MEGRIMKVAMMTYSTRPRGGVVHSSKLAEYLQNLGIDVELFSLFSEDEFTKKRDVKFYRKLRVPSTIYTFRSKGRKQIPYVNCMIKEYVDKLPKDFDIYHTHDCVGGNALYVMKKKKLIKSPTVRTIHHIDSFRSRRLLDFQKKAVTYCDHKIVVSRYWQKYLKNKMNIDSYLTYNGVETDVFNPEVNGRAVREEHELGDAPLVLFVGGLEPRKGLEYLMFAMELVRRKVPDARLLVVGKTAFSSLRGEQTFFNVLVKRLGLEDCVKFAFDIKEKSVPEYYAACDVYALPSRMEGWGLSLMEAMACGKPVVTTRVGGIPELVRSGTNGYLVQPGDTTALARRIVHLLLHDDVRKMMGRDGVKMARSFSWERTAEKVKEIYEDILQ